MKKKLVITSFEEFASRSINASREVVNSLPEKINDIEIVKKELKVSWIDIEKEIDEVLTIDSDYLILCGEAQSYSFITIEERGSDCCKGMDKYGYELNSEYTKYKDTLFNVNKLYDLNVNYSFNAGSYLCNRSYYLALNKAVNKKALFIHFPLIKEQGGKWEKEELVNTLEQIIERIEEM